MMKTESVSSDGIDEPIAQIPQADDLCGEHRSLMSEIGVLHTVAEAVAVRPLGELRAEIEAVQHLVAARLVPHLGLEHEHRAHLAFRDCRWCPPSPAEAEIGRLAEQLKGLWPAPPGDGHEADTVKALRTVLFDLHTAARLQLAGGCY